MSDTIRYTFQYQEARYTQGVLADIERLKEQGFKLDKLKNSWSNDQYKGINSQWIEPIAASVSKCSSIPELASRPSSSPTVPTSGSASQQADKFEQMVLEAFQKKVTAEVPVPPGADDIPDYP